jgi:cytochrome c-type biogenesis protein CcmH/NrfF
VSLVARRRAGRRLAAAIAAAALLAAPAAAAAQCPQTSVADVEDEVMCPVCGTPLALATEAPQADRQREFIIELVEQCKSKDEIKAALVTEFGEGVLAVPDREGFNLTAYIVPGLAALATAAVIVVATLRWRRRRPAEAVRGGGPTGEDSARLDEDLRRYDL